MPATLRTHTLGCKVNQYETEFVRQGLVSIGYRDAAKGESADLCIINTCTVTAEGDAKSRQVIRRLARENPTARLVVMGCYATRARQEVAALPGVSEIITDKRELPDLLGRFGVVDLPTGIADFPHRQRAYVKVQDGCILACSFCIIPQVRPHLVSRPPADILSEIERLLERGFHEFVLTGIHLGHYGVEWNRGRPKSAWTRLSHLLERIAALPGDFRVRLSSIEATEVTRELLRVMSEHPERICPHLHISMQSGSDRVLRRMRRRWGRQRFLDRCELAKQVLDRPAITTDIIVGFPGETEEDFEDTCEAARAVGFSKIHVFSFSPRAGTPAAELPDQVPAHIVTSRTERLRSLEAQLQQAYYRRLAGCRLRVLVESPVPGKADRWIGTACRYAPVELTATAEQRRTFAEVVAGPVAQNQIQGYPLS